MISSAILNYDDALADDESAGSYWGYDDGASDEHQQQVDQAQSDYQSSYTAWDTARRKNQRGRESLIDGQETFW